MGIINGASTGIGPAKCRQVLEDAVGLKPIEIVVNERQQRAAGRHRRIHGGRLESRNNADQVAEENENEKRSEERDDTWAVVPDLLFRLAAQKLVDHLEGVLQLAGLVDREPRPQQANSTTMIAATRICMVMKLAQGRADAA